MNSRFRTARRYMQEAGDPGSAGGAAPPTDPAPGAPAAPTDWTAGFDAATRSYVQAQGFKAPADLMATLQSYKPPESPDKYEIPIPDGDAGEFAKQVAPIFHKAGLSATQAKALAEGWNELQTAQAAAAAEAQAAADREAAALAQRQQGELKREWGQTYDANVELAKRAIRAGMGAAGLTEDATAGMIDTLEKTHGFAAVHKFFAALGAPMAEAKAHGLGTPTALPPASFYDKSNMNP